MRIAWFTPFSRRSAIGQFSAIVVRELMASADVIVFASDLERRDEAWLTDVEVRLLTAGELPAILAELTCFDAVVFNLGNHNGFHGAIYDVATRFPGVVILHDLVMHHFFEQYYLAERGDRAGYLKEIEYAHGAAGRALGEAIVEGRAGAIWHTPVMLDVHMARSAVRACLHVVVHSAFAQRALAPVADVPVTLLPFPTPSIGEAESAGTGSTAAADDRVRFLTYGMINPNKMIREIIEAFGMSPLLRRHAVFHVIGDSDHNPVYRQELDELIRAHDLGACVQLMGYQPEAELHAAIAAADVIVNIRNPHYGESSWVLLEAAFAGKATMVWRHGSYDEFPDAVVAKVDSISSLQATAERLCTDHGWRQELGRGVQAYARATFVTTAYASSLLTLLRRVQYDAPAVSLVDFVAEVLVELGVDATMSDIVAPIAGEIAAMVEGTAGITTPASAQLHDSR